MFRQTCAEPALFPTLQRDRIDTLQVNLGYRCNQSCSHCHVSAGPTRTEMMNEQTIDLVLDVLQARQISSLDLTGGAPELHPSFRYLVTAARDLGVRVIDRCNLTILTEPGQEDLSQFLASNGVVVVASLPCYEKDNVDQQRGKGVFERSIAGLKLLNAEGYGSADSGLVLNLVYNPQGAALPPPQADLERDYKASLGTRYQISFNALFAMVNMPIQRFEDFLRRAGSLEAYMSLLRNSYNPMLVDRVMCRNTISVDWQGLLYDCDFNQMLGIAAGDAPNLRHLRELLSSDMIGMPIAVGNHCFGCTAGSGSSCGGSLE